MHNAHLLALLATFYFFLELGEIGAQMESNTEPLT